MFHMSVENIKNKEPEYLPKECPFCHGRISAFGAESHQDFSKVKVICWICGRHSYFEQDEANQCYHQIER